MIDTKFIIIPIYIYILFVEETYASTFHQNDDHLRLLLNPIFDKNNFHDKIR